MSFLHIDWFGMVLLLIVAILGRHHHHHHRPFLVPTALAFAQADLDDSIGQAFMEVAPPEMRRSGLPTFGRLSSRSWHPWTGHTFIVCTVIDCLIWLPRGMSIIAYGILPPL